MCERINLSEIVDLMEEVVRAEYAEDIDVSDRVWETVDGSEWVIYYSKTAQVVAAADDDERETAWIEAAAELFGAGRTFGVRYDEVQTLMAYHILRARLYSRVTDLA